MHIGHRKEAETHQDKQYQEGAQFLIYRSQEETNEHQEFYIQVAFMKELAIQLLRSELRFVCVSLQLLCEVAPTGTCV